MKKKHGLSIFMIIFLGFMCSFTFSQENHLQQQYNKTITALKLLSDAVSDYIMDNEKAPQATTIRELLDQDIGNGLSFADFYLDRVPPDKVPSKDAWGKEFLYHAEGAHFFLASAGSNGEFMGFEQQGFYLFSDKDWEGKDIIFSESGFIFGPM